MDENYLNIPSRQSIEAYIDTLESYRNDNDPATDYSQTYLTIKKSQIMEQVDARSRLATIENKEAIDALEERLERLETPSFKLVKESGVYGAPIDCGNVFINGMGTCTYADHKYVFPMKTRNLYILDEYDNFTDIGGNAPNNKIICENFEYDDYLFNSCQVCFANNKWYLYCPHNNTNASIIWSSDLHTFYKMTSINDKIAEINDSLNLQISLDASYFFNDGDTLILFTSDSYVFKYENEEWTYYGKTHDKSNSTNILFIGTYSDPISDRENFFIDYNNKKYCYAYQKGIYSTTDYVEYIEELSETNAYNIEYFSLENNILIVSGNDWAKYYDIENNIWTDVTLPPVEEEGVTNTRQNEVSCNQGIQIRYSLLDNKYWAILHKGSTSYSGIYSWDNGLDNSPTRHFSSLDNDNFTLENNRNSTLKCFDGILYFISDDRRTGFIRGRLFTLRKGEVIPFSDNSNNFIRYSGIGNSAIYGTQSGSILYIMSINGKIFGNGTGSNYQNCGFMTPSLYKLVSNSQAATNGTIVIAK